jgi:hypothetical protein
MARLLLTLGMAVSLLATQRAAAADYRAGVARVVITPQPGLWMAGYASRNKPAEGTLHDLHAKALALEDAKGQRLVLVTTDLIGFPRSLSVAVADEVQRSTGLPREALMLTASHTHCGPVLRDNLMDMYDMPPEQMPKLKAYGTELQSQLVKLVRDALADLKPARLHTGQGTARFAVNRRKPTDKGFINAANPEGPVDHDVPVLQVTTPEGKLRTVVFGYACHNTTLQFYQWCGDYAGFAQINLEERHPGAVAMFWSGCGADANPLPRSSVELCQKYGKELAEAVEATLKTQLKPVLGTFKASYATIPLAFDKLPTKEQWAADTLSKNYGVRTRAARFLRTLESGGKIEDHYPHYPVQLWRLGDRVLWIAMGGEVVVDYSHRLKRELGKEQPVWVTAYANDVMAYIPSLRVLKEGGYEGESSMVGYGLPTKWGPEIEEKIVRQIQATMK